jgi:hypothetical protein
VQEISYETRLIFETTGHITGVEGLSFDFDTDDTAGMFEASLSDPSFGPLAFDFLGLSISTATQTLGAIDAPGSIYFQGDPHTTYYANIFGVGAGDFDIGRDGVQVAPVPIPPSLVMFLSGLFLIVVLRRRSTVSA